VAKREKKKKTAGKKKTKNRLFRSKKETKIKAIRTGHSSETRKGRKIEVYFFVNGLRKGALGC